MLTLRLSMFICQEPDTIHMVLLPAMVQSFRTSHLKRRQYINQSISENSLKAHLSDLSSSAWRKMALHAISCLKFFATSATGKARISPCSPSRVFSQNTSPPNSTTQNRRRRWRSRVAHLFWMLCTGRLWQLQPLWVGKPIYKHCKRERSNDLNHFLTRSQTISTRTSCQVSNVCVHTIV